MTTEIKMSNGTVYLSPYSYGDTFIQGGTSGLVFTHDPANLTYLTAFVECAPEGTFIRGEGATVAEADADCWRKFCDFNRCAEHEYEPRGYTNGGGFCKHCKQFGSGVFTGEQLGQFCDVCKQGTTHQKISSSGKWYCKEHSPLTPYLEFYRPMLALTHSPHDASGIIDSGARLSLFGFMTNELSKVVREVSPPDQEILDYFKTITFLPRGFSPATVTFSPSELEPPKVTFSPSELEPPKITFSARELEPPA